MKRGSALIKSVRLDTVGKIAVEEVESWSVICRCPLIKIGHDDRIVLQSLKLWRCWRSGAFWVRAFRYSLREAARSVIPMAVEKVVERL